MAGVNGDLRERQCLTHAGRTWSGQGASTWGRMADWTGWAEKGLKRVADVTRVLTLASIGRDDSSEFVIMDVCECVCGARWSGSVWWMEERVFCCWVWGKGSRRVVG